MTFHRLKRHEWLIFILLFAVGYFLITVQRQFIPQDYRYFTAFLILVLVITPFFFMVRPEKPYALSRLQAVVLGIAVAVLIVINHMIIRFDFSVKNLPLLVYAVIVPFLSGWIYQLLKREK